MFEHRREELLPRSQFYRRILLYGIVSGGIILVSLVIGVLGYHYFENMPWIDALVNASMLLGGMGPVTPLHTDAGKLFASFYALFSGMVLLVAVGVLIAPVFHRILHRFHLEIKDDD
jgi:zinc transporter ZupT